MLLAAFLAVAAIGGLAYSVQSTWSKEASGNVVPQSQALAAPNWTLIESSSGHAVSLSEADQKGPVVLEFWATWCGPCRAELPEVISVSKKFAGRVSFYGVNCYDTRANIESFRHYFQVPYPCLMDPGGKISGRYDAGSIPLLVVIDTHGKVRTGFVGWDPSVGVASRLTNALNALLAEQ